MSPPAPSSPAARVFYRIVSADPPPVEDFASPAALGEPPLSDAPERLRLHGGLSVYATEGQARSKARDYPWLGAYLARLELPDDASVRVERTTRSRGHHTLWGDASAVHRCVVAVLPVEPV